MHLHDDEALDDLDAPFTHHAAPTALTSPEPRAALAHVLQHLTSAFVGDAGGPLDDALTTLAILIAKWMCHPYALRLLLVGQTGVGKTRLLHTIAAITGVPATVLPITQVAESSWSGLQLGEVARTLHPEMFTTRGLSGRIIAPVEAIRRPCCLLLDEIDKLALVTPDRQPLDGAARAWRLGRQQTLLACLDPLSELPMRLDDVDGVVRLSLAQAIVVGAGAFPMFAPTEAVTPSGLVRVGFTAELVDRLGVILTLPQPSAAARHQLAAVAATEMLDFARSLDVDVQGLDALITSLPAPGADGAAYIGVRGLRHHVERRIADAIGRAIAGSETVARLDAGTA